MQIGAIEYKKTKTTTSHLTQSVVVACSVPVASPPTLRKPPQPPVQVRFRRYNYYYLNNVGIHLKASSGWEDNGNGDNLYNFNALPGGMHNYDGYVGIGWQASWWSVEKNIITIIWKNQDLLKMEANPYAGNVLGLSVRCVKD